MFDGPKSLFRKFETTQQSVETKKTFNYPETNEEYQQLKDDAMKKILAAAPKHMHAMIQSCAW